MLEEWESRRWRVALIAHDAKNGDLVAFAQRHRQELGNWSLVATKATGDVLLRRAGLESRRVLAGPLGGDVQIAAEIAIGEIDALIFLRDPLTAGPHEPDITALLRVADVHNVPLATNLAGAECLVKALAYAEVNATRA
jgi:methylglyoxal synthase